jgi:hypothetical protein
MANVLIIIFLTGLVVLFGVVVLWQTMQLKKLHQEDSSSGPHTKPLKITEPTQAELEAVFGTDLTATSKQLSDQVKRLTTTVIEEELEAYQKTLEQVRLAATQAMDQIHQAVEHQRIELRQGMEAELENEKKALTDKFDAKLGDVVASYISEALGSGVDLGAQMQFILTSLEAHKADIRKDLLDV